MKLPLACTLAGDGAADRALRPVLEWFLGQLPLLQRRGFTVQVAAPGANLRDRLSRAVQEYPCDVLFVHRDAEREPREKRVEEIRRAVVAAGVPACVPVVPVRMTEAWLLIEEGAIRRAAGNPNGEVSLPLPRLTSLETVADPKKLLRSCLIQASEKTGRRLEQFERDLPDRVQRVAELISDFAPLRQLPAFRDFENEAREALGQLPGS
ncbi:MAG TPA: hypothetical protein VEW48_09545 [Thermoanaerobaculia bacterium]|nr:hypothetical protein [Thermoanaerobaculia bacterium]